MMSHPIFRPLVLLALTGVAASAIDLKPGDDLQAALGNEHLRLTAGTYFITEPLQITRPVIMEAVPGAKVIISGGQKITGWKKTADQRWQAATPLRFRELYISGEPATRARHPDIDTFRIAAAADDKRTGFTFNEGDILDWKNPQQIEFVFYHDWSLSRVNIASIDLENRTVSLSDPVGQTDAGHYVMDWFEKQPRYHLENHPDFVTKIGEWYLDDAAGTVALFSEIDPNTLEIIAPAADSLLHITGTKNVRLENLTFRHMNWQLPPGGCAGVQAAFHQVRPAHGQYEGRREAAPAAVTIDNSSECFIKNCRFEQVGASGVWVRDKCSDITLESCVIRDAGANGLMIGTEQSSDDATSRVVLKDSLIERCGLTDFGAVGIWIGLANHISLLKNELRDLPYTGISIGWRWNPTPTSCHHNIAEGNHIHHIMQKLSDGGGIYTLGSQPGTVLRGNRIHDVPLNTGRAESNGMFIDEGTTGILIEDNIIWNITKSPLRFHQAGKNLVKNNRLYRASAEIPMVRYNSTPEENIVLENNADAVGAPPE